MIKKGVVGVWPEGNVVQFKIQDVVDDAGLVGLVP
jgi:hypothetical protein